MNAAPSRVTALCRIAQIAVRASSRGCAPRMPDGLARIENARPSSHDVGSAVAVSF
jgi:hypothetical protein